MIFDEKKQAAEVNGRVHLEMDEVEELLELARKTDARSWCILTLAFNHGLRVSECAGGAPAIPGKNRSAIPPLTLRDIDMKHRTIRVRRLKGSLETVQAFVEHRGKPALSDYACLKAYLAVRIDAGADLLFTGQKGPLHRWALNRMFVALLKPETSSPKPDAPTASPSDAASPRENELGIDTPSHKIPSYYIRAYQRGVYIIEYNGRQLAATCRETLTWLDGMDKPGRLMGEHDCTYMPSLVGKQIRPELMWQHDKELRYQPWLGDDTVQTADILDITAEAPVGALLRRSSPKTSPEILKTLRWIQNTLDDDEGNTVYGMSNKDGMLGTRVNLLPDVNGCQVTFAHATRGDEGKETYHQRLQVNLGDLDPTSLKVDTFTTDDVIAVKSTPEVVPGDVISRTMSTVTVHTTDKVPSVRLTLNDRNWRTGTSLSSTDLLWELPAPYAARFAKALRQAISLCGGKPSSF